MTEPVAEDPDELRRLAEDQLRSSSHPRDLMREPSQLNRIIHELQVHQIELEMQNEELRLAQAEGERLRERYSDFYDFSPSGFVSLNSQGEIIQVNLTAARLLGSERARVIGDRFATFIDWADAPVFKAFLARVFEAGALQTCDLHLSCTEGSPRTVHVEATLSPDKQECRAVLVDITEEQSAQERRRFLERELMQSQKVESLGRLAGGMAHDMNNVLGAILGLASTMRMTLDPLSHHAKSLDTITSACLRGRDVVKSLLYFAHKELREERPLDLNALATEMTQLLGSTTLQRVKLELELDSSLPRIKGDPGALNNALLNLCINAIDAMPQGGQLHLATHCLNDGSVELHVKDTGSGMSKETLAQAIEPFFTTKPLGKGTGLGLSMVYGTMAAHDGRLELVSTVGAGTEAILWFPAARTTSVAAPVPVDLSEIRPEGKALDILLVDDDPLIMEAIAGILAILGHRTIEALSGQKAIQLLEQGIPVDLVILDMNMPGMTGSQALPLIMSLRPGLPVLIDTGYTDEEMQPLLAGRQSVRSITKPFTVQELKAKIDELRVLQAGQMT